MRTEPELREALETMAAQAPAGEHSMPSLHNRRREQTARRRSFVAVSSAVVALVVVVVAIWAVLSPSRIAQPSGPLPPQRPTWAMSFRVDPPAGWHTSQEVLYRDVEQTVLKPNGSSADNPSCDVVVDPAGRSEAPAGGRSLTLGGREGSYLPETKEHRASFWWLDDSGATATAICSDVINAKAPIAEIVSSLTADRHDVMIAFTLGSLPDGLEIKTVWGSGADTWTEGVDLGDTSEKDSRGNGLSVYYWDQDPLKVPARDGGPGVLVTTAGHSAVYIAWSNSLCFEGKPTICVGNATTASPSRTSADPEVQEVFAAVKPATNLAKRSTWPSAAEGLPR